jgi:hypothetical protein
MLDDTCPIKYWLHVSEVTSCRNDPAASSQRDFVHRLIATHVDLLYGERIPGHRSISH